MTEGGTVDATTREIARGLIEVVESAIHPAAPALSASAAREVARLLDLAGLERVLAHVEAFGPRRPEPLVHVLARLERLLAAARERESVAPFVEADAELRAHADSLAGTQWAEPSELSDAPPVASISLADALSGWTLQGAEPDASPQVGAPVASALRAALDWLAVDPRVPLLLETHDDFVALHFDVHQGEGLAATGEVLETVGGHLAPIRPGGRRWRLVVPRLVARPAFLLLEQGRLGLAVPWSSVVRLRMISAERAAEEAPVLAPLRWSAANGGERPAALLAHGLRRAWLLADRVVWRFAAHAEEVDVPAPLAGLVRAVRGDEGALFWLAEPAWLLRATEAATPEIEEPAVDAEMPSPPISPGDEAFVGEPDPARAVAIESDVALDTESPVAEPADAAIEVARVLDAEVETLDFAPAPAPADPADWTEESDDAPVEWLVHSNASAPAVHIEPPALTLLGPDDVEPLAEPELLTTQDRATFAHADLPAESASHDVATLVEGVPARERDEASAPRSSRIARALEQLEATLEGTLPAERDDAREEIADESAAAVEEMASSDDLAPPASVAEAVPVVPAAIEAMPHGEEAAPAAAAEPASEPAPAAIAPVEATVTAAEPASEPAPAAIAPVEATAAAAAPAPAAATPADPAALEISSRLALVAEDSLVASIFLQRLLEQRGFRAVAVEMALDLAREIERGTWGLVFVDVHLPDARGAGHLDQVVSAARRAPGGVAVVALTRDADDEAMAAGAGIALHLRKPFEASRVDRLFTALGLPVRKERA